MAGALLDAFGNNPFLHMLKTPSYLSKVASLCDVCVQNMEEQAEQWSTLPKQLQGAMQSMRVAASGLLAIYTPIPGYSGCSARDGIYLLQYSGDCPLLSGIKTIIKDSDVWTEQADDLMKHATNCMRLAPQLSSMTKQAYEHVAVKEVSEDFKFAVQQVPGMSKDLREGALNDLESLLCRRTECIVKSFVKVTDANLLNTEDLAIIQRMLTILARWQGIPDLQEEYMKWQKTMSKGLATKQFGAWVAECLKQADDGQREDKDAQVGAAQPDYGALQDLLKRCEHNEIRAADRISDMPLCLIQDLTHKAGLCRA